MATPTEMIGEIEIIALTRALKQPLHIHMPDGSVITYGEQFSSEKPLTVLFSNLGEHVGHYDYLHTEVPSLVTPLMISPKPEAFRKTPSPEANDPFDDTDQQPIQEQSVSKRQPKRTTRYL